MARKKKAAGAVKVNFKGVESRQTPPEGDYIVEVLEATLDDKRKGKADMIEFILEIAEGKYKGVKLYLYCTLDEKSLWKLHAFLTALGVEVPEDEMDIDLSDLVGEKCVGVVTHETYNGKKRAKMTDFDSLENFSGERADDDEDEDDEDEDEKPKKGKKSKSKAVGKKSKKSKDDDEDEDDDDDDDDEDEKPSKKSKSKKSSKKSKDDEDDDDDDEDEKPAKGKKSKGKAKKPKKLDRDDVENMDEDELQELIDEHDLDVDLDDFKKLPKKVAAVLEALEEEGLVDEED